MFTLYPDKNDKNIYATPSALRPSYNPDPRPPMVVMEGCIAEAEKAIANMQKEIINCQKHIRELRELIQEATEYLDRNIS